MTEIEQFAIYLSEIIADVENRRSAEIAALRAEIADIRARLPSRATIDIPDPDWVMPKQAASEVGLSEGWIRKYRARGDIKARKIGNRVLVDISTVRTCASQRTRNKPNLAP